MPYRLNKLSRLEAIIAQLPLKGTSPSHPLSHNGKPPLAAFWAIAEAKHIGVHTTSHGQA